MSKELGHFRCSFPSVLVNRGFSSLNNRYFVELPQQTRIVRWLVRLIEPFPNLGDPFVNRFASDIPDDMLVIVQISWCLNCFMSQCQDFVLSLDFTDDRFEGEVEHGRPDCLKMVLRPDFKEVFFWDVVEYGSGKTFDSCFASDSLKDLFVAKDLFGSYLTHFVVYLISDSVDFPLLVVSRDPEVRIDFETGLHY